LALKGIELPGGRCFGGKIGTDRIRSGFGGRELRRAVQDNVENAIATALLQRAIRRGDIVEVDPYTWQTVVAGKTTS